MVSVLSQRVLDHKITTPLQPDKSLARFLGVTKMPGKTTPKLDTKEAQPAHTFARTIARTWSAKIERNFCRHCRMLFCRACGRALAEPMTQSQCHTCGGLPEFSRHLYPPTPERMIDE
jgi:hypothetical protein